MLSAADIDIQRQPDHGGSEFLSGSLSPPRRNRHRSNASWSLESVASGFPDHSEQNSRGIITRLSTLFENVEDYKRLLARRDLTAQRLLDLFQTVCMIIQTSHRIIYNI